MASPTDYFMQGTSLGMRAAQSAGEMSLSRERLATEKEMFRTNFAERVRQFDLGNQLARDQFELQNKRFTLEQESAIIEQKLQKIQLDNAQTQNNEMMRVINDRVKYKPEFDKYHSQLINWNGVGEPPQVPSGWPKEIRDEAMAVRSNIYESALQNKVLQTEQAFKLERAKKWTDGLDWMRVNHPDKVRFDKQTQQLTYNEREYDQLRSQSVKRAAMLEARKIEAEYRKTQPKTVGQKIEDFASRDAENFYVKSEETGEYYFDKKGFQEALAAAVGAGIVNPVTNSKDDPYDGISERSIITGDMHDTVF